MAEKVRLAVLGSCVSRDALGEAFFPDDRFEVVAFYARTSLASIFSPPLPFDPERFRDLRAFELKCLRADWEKTAFRAIVNSNFDYLLLDFIDERYDLLEIDGSIVTSTGAAEGTGFVARDYFRPLPRERAYTMGLWKQGAARLIAELRARGLPENRIILHEAVWAPANEDPESPRYERFDRLRGVNNELLRQYFSYIKSLAPGVRVLRVESEFVQSDPAHIWNLAPFHYAPPYYARFLQKLRAICGLNEPAAAATGETVDLADP